MRPNPLKGQEMESQGAGAMVALRSAGRAFDGYLAQPKAPGPHPGLVVIHEIFGLTPWLRSVADRLAAQGFFALAPDLFTGRLHPKFTHETAERMMPLVWQMPVDQRIDESAFRTALKGHRAEDIDIAWRLSRLTPTIDWLPPVLNDLKACVASLRGRRECSGKVGAIGFCLGGRLSFHLATVDRSLNAAVVFYGAGPREEEVERIGCPVLGLYGEDDEMITKDVPRVAAAMERFGKSFEHEIYNRTGHAFARPGSKGYREDRATDAWARTDDFLRRFLG
jgi:carboxymethylenebutenolidase